jgi:hypothetical protein
LASRAGTGWGTEVVQLWLVLPQSLPIGHFACHG